MVKEKIMKRYKSIILVLFSILACQSEINQNENTNENAIPMSFYAGIEIPKDSSLTKTVLAGSPADAFRNVLWEYQDEVYVTNGSQSAKFINTSQGTSEIALLEGQLAEGANYFAAYPFNIVTNSSASSFSVDLPSEQTYCADGIDSEAFPMVAQCKEGVFNFKNLCGILVLRFIGEKSVSSITFSGKDSDGNNMPIAGVGTVSMSYSDYPSMSLNSSLTYKVTLNCGAGVSLNSTTPTSFHLVLPVGTYCGFELQIETTDGSKMVVNSDKTLNIKRSTRTTTAPLTYIDIIDLSSLGTANCYIVSNAGKYKFNASVKGNSTEYIGTVATAEVLWESFGTDVTPSVGDIVRNVTYMEGYIEFETPTELAEGNAVVAAKDASGTILWSWHIWVTDMPDEHIYPNNAGTMMDRNLGATSATPGDVCALGLLYQWGRKDPFLANGVVRETTQAKTTKYMHDVSSGEGDRISYSIAHPSEFITSVYYNWVGNSNKSELWGRGMSKTQYDPCPIGWHVPSKDIWVVSGIESSDYSFDTSLNGFYFTTLSGATWYPAVASRPYDSGELETPSSGNYWSATPYDGDTFSYKSGNLEFSSGYIRDVMYVIRGNAKSVRCLKE